MLFTILVTLVTAVVFGLAPAFATLNSNVGQSLKGGDRGTTVGASRGRLRSWLVATEIALALVLLAGAGLLMRTFMNLQHVSPGFEPDHVLTFHTELPAKRYEKDDNFIAFYKNLTVRLQKLPGVQFVGVGSDVPWTGYDENTDMEIEGRPTDPSAQSPEARYHFATPDYFSAIGIPLLSGRFFNDADTQKSQKVTIVNSAFARRYFPGENPLGKRLDLWGQKGVTIVGVVGDVKDSPDSLAAKPSLYWDDWQFPQENERIVVLRAGSNLSSLSTALQGEVAAIDKDIPVTAVKPMDEIGVHAIAGARFTVLLVGVFAGLALVLAAIGILGVMSYSVTQRTHEIGIRMALGAQQQDVLSMVVTQGAKLAAFGVGVGLIAGLALTRAMRGLLYGIGASDPWTFACVAALLVVVALGACYVPARRAAKVDPIVALRYE